jgi:hypothetical protein
VRRRLPLPVDTRSTIADTDFPATAEWRSLRLTGEAKRNDGSGQVRERDGYAELGITVIMPSSGLCRVACR